jgi:hypothetical protein
MIFPFQFFHMGKISPKKRRSVEHLVKWGTYFYSNSNKKCNTNKKIGSTILIDKIFKEQFDKYLLVKNIEILRTTRVSKIKMKHFIMKVFWILTLLKNQYFFFPRDDIQLTLLITNIGYYRTQIKTWILEFIFQLQLGNCEKIGN